MFRPYMWTCNLQISYTRYVGRLVWLLCATVVCVELTILSLYQCHKYKMKTDLVLIWHCSFIHSFIHSLDMWRIRWFLAVLRSFFHSSLLCTFSCHPSPPSVRPSSLTSSCHLFLGLPLPNLVVPKLIYNTLLGILFSSILCTCPN